MKQYYYVNSAGQQAGPVAGESLKQYNVTEETLVWCEGMSNWAKAENVEELKPLFVSTPPPPPSQPKYTEDHASPTALRATIRPCPNNVRPVTWCGPFSPLYFAVCPAAS